MGLKWTDEYNSNLYNFLSGIFSSVSVQSLNRVRPFLTPWTAAYLSITNSGNLLQLMSIESVMPSNHLILCRPLLLPPSIFPSTRVFPMSQPFASGSQSIGASASASVFPMTIQDWFPLGACMGEGHFLENWQGVIWIPWHLFLPPFFSLKN